MVGVKKSTICLNMIVKDEGHIIEKTLNNLQSIFNFDYWVICDTGSSDNTKDIISKFFEDVGVPGELVTHKWEGFDVCRTYALEQAYNKSDYNLIFDADDYIEGNFIIPNDRNLTKDIYYLKLGNNFTFYRGILINNRLKWCFKGVVHEYLQNLEPLGNGTEYINGDYYIVPGHDGARSNNSNKYIDDANVLEKELEKNIEDKVLKNRYIYYCAQSFYDGGDKENALKYYKMTLSNDNWKQEKYISCMRIGDIYHQKDNIQEALIYWDGACQFDTLRLDGVSRIVKYLYSKGNHTMVMYYYNKYKHINEIKDSSHYLLLDKESFYNIRYFACISAYYKNEKIEGYNCCKCLIINNKQRDKKNVYRNMKFYIDNFNHDNDDKKFLILENIFKYICSLGSSNSSDDNIMLTTIYDYIEPYLKIYRNELYITLKKILNL